MSTLVLRDLSRVYGTFKAVDNVSLEFNRGEFVSLLGPSGCGKTTTLRMIAGFIDPTAGQIELNGQIISSPQGSIRPEKRGMSMIFQSYAIWPNMTVAENVAFGLKLKKLSKAEIATKVSRILETVKLLPLQERYPSELSGGQQQRVALARAIVVEPAILLLDEPLSNLDANLREEMRFEIRRLHDEFRITTVYVTHDQSEAMVTSDRIAVMNQGRVEQIDKPFTIYTKPKTRFVARFIGRTNLLEGRWDGDAISFGGFSVKAGHFPHVQKAKPLDFSLRPQSIRLTRSRPDRGGVLAQQGRVIERAFLGETWDYVVAVEGLPKGLRVSAPHMDVFEADELLWIDFDPDHMAHLSE